MAKVLVIDDSATVALVVRRILSADHHEVAAVGSLAEVPGAVAAQRPDLLLLDLELPDAGELGAAYLPPGIPILVHSSRPYREMIDAATRLHAAGVVPKGASPQELQQAVRRALGPPNGVAE